MTTEDANRLLPRRLFDDTEADLHFIPLLLCCHCYCYSYCSGTATATAASLICTMIASAFASRVQPSSFSLYFGRPMAAAALVLLLAFCRLLQEDGGWRQASATFASGPCRASHKRPLCMVATPPCKEAARKIRTTAARIQQRKAPKARRTKRLVSSCWVACLVREASENSRRNTKMKIRCSGSSRNSLETATTHASQATFRSSATCASVHGDGTAPVSTKQPQNPYDMVYSLGR